MNLDNQNMKQAYVQLLIDTLSKKSEILDHLMSFTKQQEDLISSEQFNEEKFLSLITGKEAEIQQIDKLDMGFDRIFEGVKEEITGCKEKYLTEILKLKTLITEVTDKSVKLQAMEKRNKSKLESILINRRNNIKTSRISNKMAVNYYKAMTNHNDAQSFFYDKKN